MTGYESKKSMAQDKLEQWDMPSKAFNEWWDSDYDDSTNPYEINTFAYWAWAGWQAALAQPAQRTWVDLTPQDLNEIFAVAMTGEGAVHLALEKIKEKNT